MKNYNYQLNLKNLFSNTKTLFGSKEIVYRDIKRYTYSEFLDRVNGLCIGLQEIGVKKGDTIGVLDWDTIEKVKCLNIRNTIIRFRGTG
ncbi:MAG: hypothetical protein QXV17_12775 [Candidatus Micrarchaeaceae archaeon]